MVLKLPIDFAKKIGEVLVLQGQGVDILFDVSEDKAGYFVAKLKQGQFLEREKFRTMCALARDLGGEGYIEGAKAWKIPGPYAKSKTSSGQGMSSEPAYKEPRNAIPAASTGVVGSNPTREGVTPNSQIEAAKARRDSGDFFEDLAIQILPKLGFSNVVKEKKSQPFDFRAEKDGEKCFIEVKGRDVNRSVDLTSYLIQYEKLWNLIEISGKGQVYFLFLTHTDSKLVKYEELTTPEYTQKHKLTFTVKAGSRIDRWLKNQRLLGDGDRFVVINELLSMPFQSRKSEDPEIDQLVESIKQYGILEPILVRQKPGALFEVVAGERRLAAAKKAGLTRIPAIVKDVTDEEALVLQLTENLQRKDLTEEEKSGALAELARRTGWSAQQIADHLKMSERWVYKDLPGEFKKVEPEQLAKGREESQESIDSARRALSSESQDTPQGILTKEKPKTVSCARCGEIIQGAPVHLGEGKYYDAECAEAVVEESKSGHGPSIEPGSGVEEVEKEAVEEGEKREKVEEKTSKASRSEQLKAVQIGEFECTECNKRFLIDHMPNGKHKLKPIRESEEE